MAGSFNIWSRRLHFLEREGAGGQSGLQHVDPESTRPGNDLPYTQLGGRNHTSFDRKIVLCTAAFLFLLVAALALHMLIRWILRRFATRPSSPSHAVDSTKPMKLRHVKSLPTSTFSTSTDDQSDDVAPHCTICLSSFCQGDTIRVLPTCHHGFHARCVDTWLVYQQATCPICRADLLKAEETSRSVEVRVVITPRGELRPTLCGEPKDPYCP